MGAPRRRERLKAGEVPAFGTFLGGALAGLEIKVREDSEPPLMVAGVDLRQVDLRRPFIVDFRVRNPRESVRRVYAAAGEFRSRFPAWIVTPAVDVRRNVFQLQVDPTPVSPEASLARRLFR